MVPTTESLARLVCPAKPIQGQTRHAHKEHAVEVPGGTAAPARHKCREAAHGLGQIHDHVHDDAFHGPPGASAFSALNLQDELLGVVRKVDDVAPLLHDIAHARADNRPAGRHVFQHLDRVDKLGGGVER